MAPTHAVISAPTEPTRTMLSVSSSNSMLTARQGSRSVVRMVKPRFAVTNGVSVSMTEAKSEVPAPTPAAAPAAPAPPPPSVSILPPPASFQNVVNVGAAKAAMPAWKTFMLGLQAGCYLSLGGFLAVMVGGSLAGALPPGLIKLIVGIVFPVGLMITLLFGAELYTGNTYMVTAAMLEGKASFKDGVKNFSMSYLGNFVGSLLIVAAAVGTGLLAGNNMPIVMATAKTSLTFGQAFIRAVLCNWLVCSAVTMAASATSLPGKTLGCWLPVTAFVTIGLEHSIANMFFVSLGIALGAPGVTFMDFLVKNLLPVTLGNTLAGVLFMAVAYSMLYGTMLNPKTAAA